MIEQIIDLFIYWPIAVIGASTGLIGWLLWVISISIANTRWRKAIENGRYANKKIQDYMKEQKTRIIYLERENAYLKKESLKFKNTVQSIVATGNIALIGEK